MNRISVALVIFAGVTYLSYRLLSRDNPPTTDEAVFPRRRPLQDLEWRSWVNWLMESPMRQFYLILPLGVLNFFFARAITRSLLLGLIWAIIISTIGYFGVNQLLYLYRTRMNRQLLDLVNALAGSINAGLSLQQAFEAIADEETLPLSKEFARAVHEWHLGMPLEVVLEHLNRRIQSPDLQLLSSVLLLNQELGGDLSGMLDRTALALRERDRLRRELRRSTAQARLTTLIGVTLPCVLATLIHLLNPAYLRPLYHTRLGLTLLGIGVLLMAVGVVIIHKMSHSVGN